MLLTDWTGQLAGERVAEFHRQAQRQRLARLARWQRRGGDRGSWRGRRLRRPSGPETRPCPLWPAGIGIVAGIHRPVIELSTGR
jgi:hypothetical protein